MKTVLITGASTGIGKAAAELFFARGWNVVATMRTPRSDREDGRWLATRLDVTDPASIAAAFKLAQERYGQIDVLVNNAGYGLVGTLESMSEEQIRQQFETNVFGLMRMCQAVVPQFRERGEGTLINIASMGGRLTFPFYSIYHASKWAVDGFTESLAFELEPLGIRVRLVEPGAIKTDFYDRSETFVHNRELLAYNNLVDGGIRRMKKAGAKGAPASLVAETIWKAANDKAGRLRYVVGSDAKGLLGIRRLIGGDAAWRKMIAGQLLK